MTKVENNLVAVKKAAAYFRDEIAKYKEFCKEEECLMLPSQAAAMLGISPQAVESRMKEGSLTTFTVLGRHWVSGREIENVLMDRVRKAAANGTSEADIQIKIFKKMAANATVMKRRAQKAKLEKKKKVE
ncbi:MAG: hypothetical protein AB7E95_02950 [Kiritimatiellales bacterium]